MTTAALVGAGEIGGATAHALTASTHARRILLVDPAAAVAAGKALDLQQGGAIEGWHTRLDATDDLARVTGCDVCVVADAVGNGEWRGDAGLALVRRLLPYLGRAPIVFAGAQQTGLLAAAATELRIDPRRLIGSAPEAFVSAVTAIVAMEADCSPGDVRVTVLGAPPSGLVVAWSEASIGGYALGQVLAPVQLARLEARMAHLWPPGPSTLGAAAARVTAAILSSSRRSLCVLTQLGGEFGVRNRPGCLPARLGPRGIDGTRVPELTARERVQVQTALGA
jgi:malate dehydrogenase